MCNDIKEIYLNLEPQVCCICFDNFDDNTYLEIMSEEDLNFLDEPIPIYEKDSIDEQDKTISNTEDNISDIDMK